MKNVSIRDVATLAGVSIATVSHVINGTRNVNDTTRAAVEKAIEELHYVPDSTARSFKTGKRNLVGFVVPDISNAYFSTMIEEVEDILAQEGYRLLVLNTREDPVREAEGLNVLTSGLVDGLILATTMTDCKCLTASIPNGFPVVLIDRYLPGAPYDAVSVSSYGSMRLGIDYLIRKGHRKIGFLTGIPNISTTADRLKAYQDGMAAGGLSTKNLIQVGTSSTKLRSENLDALLEQGCTALVVSNNVLSIEARILLGKRNISVPNDIEILGFLDSDHAQYGLQKMSLINQPTAEQGRTAGRLLLSRMHNADAPLQNVILQAAFMPVEQNKLIF